MIKSISVPLVEILLPVFNAEDHLEQCLTSLLTQTYENCYFTIVDDCSTDKSADILNFFKVYDERINVHTNVNNLGIVECRNLLISKSTAPYIAFMDADDICFPNRIEKQVEYLQENASVDAVTCWYQRFGDRNDIIRTPTESEEIAAALFLDNVVCNPGVMVRRHILIHNDIKCDPKYRGAADYKMWVDLTSRFNLSCIPDVLLQYRTHISQESQKNNCRQRKAHFAVVEHQFSKLGINLVGSSVSSLSWPIESKLEELDYLGKWVGNISQELKDSDNNIAPLIIKFADIRFRSCCQRFGLKGLMTYIRTRGLKSFCTGRKLGISFALSCFKQTIEAK